jgi:hypothetical protein
MKSPRDIGMGTTEARRSSIILSKLPSSKRKEISRKCNQPILVGRNTSNGLSSSKTCECRRQKKLKEQKADKSVRQMLGLFGCGKNPNIN